MSTTFEPTEQDWAVINDFRPPKVSLGDYVGVYAGGDLTGAPKWGMVIRVEEKSVIAVLLDRDVWLRSTESMRHVSDPWLRFMPRIQSKGTWDLHPVTKARNERIKSLEDRLAALESGKPLDVSCNGEAVKVAAPPPRKKIKVSEVTDAYKEEIYTLSDQGKKPREIADYLGAGWSKQLVGMILAKRETVTA